MGISMHSQLSKAPTRVGGFLIGCQAWTFNKFTVAEAIQLTATVGGNVIEFFPGQKIEPGSNEGLGPDNSQATLDKVKAMCEKAGVTPVAFGVTGFGPNESECRKLAEFAKKLNLRAITCEVGPDSLKVMEKFVKDLDIQIAIHNHPRRANDPSYKVWDPKYVAELVAPFDKRIGSCADTGHWVRSGIDPVEALKILKGRVHASHLKDLNVKGPTGHDVPYGTGVSNVPGILTELTRQKYQGHLSVEYEFYRDGKVPIEEVTSCMGFLRGWGAARAAK